MGFSYLVFKLNDSCGVGYSCGEHMLRPTAVCRSEAEEPNTIGYQTLIQYRMFFIDFF